MEDRVANIAKLIAGFDGSLDSAERILDEIEDIRGRIRQEIAARTRELNAIDSLHEYISTKRNELAHNFKPIVKEALTMVTKKERVEAVIDAAMAIVQDDIPIFDTEDIQRQLEKMKIDLGVSFPPAVIATILTADKRFKKNDQGLYEYIGNSQNRKVSRL